jgi:hypothetical protein
MEKYDVIVAAERQFAREVTLGVIVARPLTAWYYLIPGFFIIDYLRRASAIRQYTTHFMFPRQLAMDAAAAEMRGENIESMRSDLEDKTRIWLESLKLYSPDLVMAHLELIEVLAAHYLKLLNADGDSMNLLIEHAYQDGADFQQFIQAVTAAENEVDRQVMAHLGGNEKVKEKMEAEQAQIAKRRNKILEAVF